MRAVEAASNPGSLYPQQSVTNKRRADGVKVANNRTMHSPLIRRVLPQVDSVKQYVY